MLLLCFYFCQIGNFGDYPTFEGIFDGIVFSYFSYSIYEIFWPCFIPCLN